MVIDAGPQEGRQVDPVARGERRHPSLEDQFGLPHGQVDTRRPHGRRDVLVERLHRVDAKGRQHPGPVTVGMWLVRHRVSRR